MLNVSILFINQARHNTIVLGLLVSITINKPASVHVFDGVLYVGVSDMEMNREADSNDLTECLHDVQPRVGMFVFFSAVIYHCFVLECFFLYFSLMFLCQTQR